MTKLFHQYLHPPMVSNMAMAFMGSSTENPSNWLRPSKTLDNSQHNQVIIACICTLSTFTLQLFNWESLVNLQQSHPFPTLETLMQEARLDDRCPVEEPANVLLQLALTLPNGQGLPTLPDLSFVIGMVPLPSLSKCPTVSSNSLQEQATASGLQDLWVELVVPNRSLQDGRSNHWKKSKRSF